MEIDNIGGHRIERYTSIDDVPIGRYMNFVRFVMLDAAIGADPESINAHDKKIIMYAKRGEIEKIIQETKNRNQSMNWVLDNINPEFMSFAVLVKSIDNKGVYDISDENCKALVKQFARWNTKKGIISKIIDFVKKNFENEIDTLFPDVGDDPELKELYGKRKSRVKMICQKLITRNKTWDDQIAEIEEQIMILFKPKSYAGANGVEAKFMKAFEEMSFILGQHTNKDVESMTARQYLTAWQVLKQQMKPPTKAKKKRY